MARPGAVAAASRSACAPTHHVACDEQRRRQVNGVIASVRGCRRGTLPLDQVLEADLAVFEGAGRFRGDR
jgi:hypothetical protein